MHTVIAATPLWNGALTDWRDWLIAAGRPATTLRLRLYQVGRFAADHPDPWGVATIDIVRWLAQQGWSVETRRSFRSALVTFYSWAEAAELVGASPATSVPSVRAAAGQPRPAPETVVRAGLGSSDPRVELMVLLAARQGLRRGEIARIHIDDLVEDLGGYSLRVHGKGGKIRTIPLFAEVATRLLGVADGWLFPGRDNGHLSPDYVGRMVARALPAGWSAHTLRHRFATRAYAGSRDLLAVQDLLGHSTPTTTRRYILMPDDAMRAALRHAA